MTDNPSLYDMAEEAAPQPTEVWKNRIIGYSVERAGDLLGNPHNWRIHTRIQQQAMEGVLGKIGWIDDVIVNKTTQHIVDGHMRVTMAMRVGEHTAVPVKWVELTPEEERLAIATYNPLGAMAIEDEDQYGDLLSMMDEDDRRVVELLSMTDEPQPAEPEPPEDPALSAITVEVLPGDEWSLGPHRLLCGDGTAITILQAWEQVMGITPELVRRAEPQHGVLLELPPRQNDD
jgi:hypothetical protein